jgi:hypothetical protein
MTIVDIIPAIVGFSLFSILLLISVYKKSKYTVFLSFLLLCSGFGFQSIAQNSAVIKNFFREWKDLIASPPITILSTALGIFVGNLFLKIFTTSKERFEISALFIRSIEEHISTLEAIKAEIINSSDNHDDLPKERIILYISKIEIDRIFEAALGNLGKFDEVEKNLLIDYSSYINRTSINIRTLLQDVSRSKVQVICQVDQTTFLGSLCILDLADKYLENRKEEKKLRFKDDYSKITRKYRQEEWRNFLGRLDIESIQKYDEIMKITINDLENTRKKVLIRN